MANSRAPGLALLVITVGLTGVTTTAEPPKVLRHVIVSKEPGRFAGWPANHGIWSWADEILVGFSRGTYKDRGPYHHIDHDRPEEFLLARSRDGGLTWSVERPGPAGRSRGRPGCDTDWSRPARPRNGRPTSTGRSTSPIRISP